MIMKSGRCSEDAYRRLRYDQIVEPSPEDWIYVLEGIVVGAVISLFQWLVLRSKAVGLGCRGTTYRI